MDHSFTPSRQRRSLACAMALTAMAQALPVVAQVPAGGAHAPHPPRAPLPPLQNTDRQVLVIEGPQGLRRYTLAQLEALGVHEVTTSTFWPDDNGTYQGPLLADVLRDAGLAGAPLVRVVALDGFSQRIPHEDWSRWPMVLATRRNGQAMGTRSKGPLRIVYPRDMDPSLEQGIYRLRWVWMVSRIDTQHRP